MVDLLLKPVDATSNQISDQKLGSFELFQFSIPRQAASLNDVWEMNRRELPSLKALDSVFENWIIEFRTDHGWVNSGLAQSQRLDLANAEAKYWSKELGVESRIKSALNIEIAPLKSSEAWIEPCFDRRFGSKESVYVFYRDKPVWTEALWIEESKQFLKFLVQRTRTSALPIPRQHELSIEERAKHVLQNAKFSYTSNLIINAACKGYPRTI